MQMLQRPNLERRIQLMNVPSLLGLWFISKNHMGQGLPFFVLWKKEVIWWVMLLELTTFGLTNQPLWLLLYNIFLPSGRGEEWRWEWNAEGEAFTTHPGFMEVLSACYIAVYLLNYYKILASSHIPGNCSMIPTLCIKSKRAPLCNYIFHDLI